MEITHVGQLINVLAKKAGVDENDDNLKNLLANADLTKINIHGDLAKQFDENLLSIGTALDSHPTLRNKYFAEVLNPFDKRMQDIIEEMELDDTGKAELKNVRSSYKRFEALTAKMKELGAAKGNANSKTDKDALQKQIDDLQLELKKAKEEVTKKESEYKEKMETDRKDFRLRSHLAGYKTTLDSLDPEVRDSTILNLINKNLEAQDAELRLDEKGNLQPYKKDGSKLYGANHTLIDLKSLVESLLAQNKILQVTDTTKVNNQQQNHQQNNNNHTVIVPDGQQKVNGTNQTVADLNLAALKAIETSESSV